jgi:hypothetical protein
MQLKNNHEESAHGTRQSVPVEVGHQVKSRVHVFQKTASHVWNDVVGR